MSYLDIFDSYMLATSKCPKSVDHIFDFLVIDAKEVSDTLQKNRRVQITISIF